VNVGLYADRTDAGIQLALALEPLALVKPAILGIPRGGVPVAAEIARHLDGDLGVVVARKLGAPSQPELAIGAVTADGTTYIDEKLAARVGASRQYLRRIAEAEQAEAKRREEAFGTHDLVLEGRDVVVVDDGIATGATAIAALRSVRAAGAARVVLAVPVGPRVTLNEMCRYADDVVCPAPQEEFYAVGQFYFDFRAPSDETVRDLLQASR
jgi:predicted phosphoribosyltransferase